MSGAVWFWVVACACCAFAGAAFMAAVCGMVAGILSGLASK